MSRGCNCNEYDPKGHVQSSAVMIITLPPTQAYNNTNEATRNNRKNTCCRNRWVPWNCFIKGVFCNWKSSSPQQQFFTTCWSASFTRSCCSCCVEVARAAKIYSKSLTTIERCEKSCLLCIWYWACWWLGLLWAELSEGTPMTNVNFCWYKQDLHFEDHWIRDLKLHQYEEVWCGSFCLGH